MDRPTPKPAKPEVPVLVVSPDPVMQHMEATFLERRGFAPHLAGRVEEVQARKDKMVLLDVTSAREEGLPQMIEGIAGRGSGRLLLTLERGEPGRFVLRRVVGGTQEVLLEAGSLRELLDRAADEFGQADATIQAASETSIGHLVESFGQALRRLFGGGGDQGNDETES